MIQNLILAALCASLVAACTPGPRKAAVNKRLAPNQPVVGNEAGGASAIEGHTSAQNPKVKALVSGSTACIPLEKIVAQLSSQTKDSFSVNLRNSDLVDKQGNGWSGDDKTRARIILAEDKPELFEMFFGGELLKSKLVGPYLDLKQDDCKSVTFADGKTFLIDPKSINQIPERDAEAPTKPVLPTPPPGKDRRTRVENRQDRTKAIRRLERKYFLHLVGENGEKRNYTVSGNRILIEIIQPTSEVITCSKATVSGLSFKRDYALDFSGEDVNYGLNSRFANLLKATLQTVPSNFGQRMSQPPSRQTARSGAGADGSRAGGRVSASTLILFQNEIKAGLLNPTSCK